MLAVPADPAESRDPGLVELPPVVDSAVTPCPASCRACGEAWPCDGSSSWAGGHLPDLIPVGAVLTTVDDLDRLISWSPGGKPVVVLDRFATPWILFADEDLDQYAATIECPDDGLPDRYDIEQLPGDRGPLRVLFNGELDTTPGTEVGQ